jgi:tRNA-specific 2-thiouridylase
MKIAVGMSGGVDSSVAALLLKQQGHEVTGVTMKIWAGDPDAKAVRHACYGPGEESEIAMAGRICEVIGIPHRVYDLSEAYAENILGYFKNEYLQGRTPNPCVMCNAKMKFGLLPAAAFQEAGADSFATGHYARTSVDEKTGRALLMKARDTSKDQSYFIHRLTQYQLKRAIFPLGDLMKSEVREIAAENGLPSWDDPESQDFYDGDYQELLGCGDDPGEIVDAKGKVLGSHKGIWNYTVGQRRGLGIAAPEPLYVAAIDPSRKRVVVTGKRGAEIKIFNAADFNRLAALSPDSGEPLTVKTRSSHQGAPCRAEEIDQSTVRVTLDTPEPGIAPGQSAVLYQGDLVMGGGIIEYC